MAGVKSKSGRKKTTKVYSDKVKDLLNAELSRCPEKYGKSWVERLVEIAMSDNNLLTVNIGAMKLISDILVVKTTEKTVEHPPLGIVHIPLENPIEPERTLLVVRKKIPELSEALEK